MDPNGKCFKAKIEVPRSGVERSEKGRASEQIGLGGVSRVNITRSDQSECIKEK